MVECKSNKYIVYINSKQSTDCQYANIKCKYCGLDMGIDILYLKNCVYKTCDCCFTSHVFIRITNDCIQLFRYTIPKKLSDSTGYEFTYINDSVRVEYYSLLEGVRCWTDICFIDKYIDPDKLFKKINGLKLFS